MLPQLPIPRPILKPLIHRLANLPHRQDKPALRFPRRLRTRRRVQRVESSFERRHGRGDFHRKLHERAEEGRVLALEVRLDDARVEGVGCYAYGEVLLVCGLIQRVCFFYPFFVSLILMDWGFAETYLERCTDHSTLWHGESRLASSASSVAWWT